MLKFEIKPFHPLFGIPEKEECFLWIEKNGIDEVCLKKKDDKGKVYTILTLKLDGYIQILKKR
jgi:hypothetical protein